MHVRAFAVGLLVIASAGLARAAEEPALVDAARRGDVAALDKAIAESPRLAATDTGAAALCAAAEEGKLEAVKALLAAGANPNRCAEEGTPLAKALECRVSGGGFRGPMLDRDTCHPEVAIALLEAGALPAHLAQACTSGSFRLVKMLLDKGLGPDGEPDKTENTAIMHAVFADNPRIVRELLARGANPRATNNDGFDAVAVAHNLGRGESEALLQAALSGAKFAVDKGCPATTRACPDGTALIPCEEKNDQSPVPAFCLDVTEVTVEAYEACASAGKCSAMNAAEAKRLGACNAGRKDRRNHPANCVTFSQASAYCAAQGKRLPTYEEWYAAAVGPEGRVFPWGARLQPGTCWSGRVPGDKKSGRRASTCAVEASSKDRSPQGVVGLAGNVSEWTSTPYLQAPFWRRYPNASPKEMSVAGGNWRGTYEEEIKPRWREGNHPEMQADIVGFRCAADAAAP